MKSLIKKFSILLFVSLVSACSVLNSAEKSDANARLTALMETYAQQKFEASPLAASMFGAKVAPDSLDDVSEEAQAAAIARMTAALAELAGIPFASLSPDNQLNYEIFQWMLEREKVTLNSNWRYVNFNTVGGWHSSFAQIMAMTAFSNEQSYRDYLSRLEKFGRFVDQNIALMDKAISAGYAQPCAALGGYENGIVGYISKTPEASVFYAPFMRLPATMDQSMKGEAKRLISEVVNPGYQRYYRYFTERYKPSCRKNIALSSAPGGAKLYEHFVRFYTSLDTTADEAHALGLSEVARIRTEMDAIIAEVGFKGSFSDFLKFLRTDKQFYTDDPAHYRAVIAEIAKRTDGLMPNYFSHLPRNPYGIKPVPAAIAPKTATAFYQPGAVDGTRAGQYFYNTHDLGSRPLYELPALSLHEGVPGHHHQISLQQEVDNMPTFRQSYYFHAFGEGWGLYSEFLGEEMGMYQTPYERFGKLIYEMWRACRLVVDSGMHAKGWTRQQAIDFMAENTALTLHNITSEVDRYITYPGQAQAYKHGELKIRELRARAENALGDKFSLREFHTAVLGAGSLPLLVLERRIDRWIAEQNK